MYSKLQWITISYGSFNSQCNDIRKLMCNVVE
uniref:Biopterin-dependent aromatic amino acid hydroxylase family profile domain-containing protein n=1 Tax=Anguilla anguilla TaxID=7936 RepID=A0A0E9R9F2_ANGAN